MQWLVSPIRDQDVLIHGERVLYRNRRHFAAVFPELWQLVAVVFLRLAFEMRDITGLSTVLVFGTVLALIVLRPLVVRERWSTRDLILAAIVALWAVSTRVSPGGFADLVLLAMAVRFLVRTVRWGFFQRLYLTDRRLMEVDGFLGVRINSMPITKVTDVMLERTVVGELLGYGTFRVESAGQDQALGRLDYLLDPEDFHDLVVGSPAWHS